MSQRNPPSLDVSTRVKPSLRGSAPLHGLLSLRVCVLFDRGSNSSSRNFATNSSSNNNSLSPAAASVARRLSIPSPPLLLPQQSGAYVRALCVREGRAHTQTQVCVCWLFPRRSNGPLLLCVYQSPSRSRGVTTKPPVRAEKANKRPIVSSVCVLIVGDSLPKKVSIAPAKEERGLPKHLRHDLWRRVNYSCKLPLI